jgi:hypothetical protein
LPVSAKVHSMLWDLPYKAFAADIRCARPRVGRYQQGMKALLLQLWRPPPLRPCPAPEILELHLLPSSRLRVAVRLFLLMILLHALELWLTGHWLAAPLVLLAAAGYVVRKKPAGHDPCWLVLDRDGQMFLRSRRGSLEPVQLGAASLRLGSHLLLILRGSHRTIRLLLGPDNLAPDLLAAFKRRLPGTSPAGTALHSVPATGSKPRSP